jgi:RHS repeat-associated protein
VLDDDGSLTAGDIRDKGGRLIRRRVQGRVQNLGYDGRNRLTRWDWDGSAGTSCTYDYDHAGRRILTRETVGGTTKVTRYVYDGADVCAEYEDSNNDGTVDRTRVYWLLPGMDRRIGFAETVNSTTTFYYYLTDHVGTVLRIVKEDGTVVNQYDYDAFGRVRINSASTFEGIENRYLFQGREWDKNGGFYYFRNRIYLPERGEFATPDMNLSRGILGELDGMATLTFCGGDPVNCIDPTGLDALHNTMVNETAIASLPYTTLFPPPPAPKRTPPRNDLVIRASPPGRAAPPRHFLRAARNDAAAFTYQQATCGQYPLGSPAAEAAVKAQFQIIGTMACPSTALIYSAPDVGKA